MAIPGITYRLEKGLSLTHQEMDNNFRSVIYSSSLEGSGSILKLHYDSGDFVTIPLGGTSASSSILNNVDNQVITGTGIAGLLQGEPSFTFDGSILRISGSLSLNDNHDNILIINSGSGASINYTQTSGSVVIGVDASINLAGANNVIIGRSAAQSTVTSYGLTAIGYQSLANLASDDSNTAIGANTGLNIQSGDRNVLVGYAAGPTTTTAYSADKLYINNQADDNPLIYGDFANSILVFNADVSASAVSASTYYGDGSNLTGIAPVAAWSGLFEGAAEITGSFAVTGSVDFSDVTWTTGSLFSGSFSGDGSGLTGVTADTFPYTGSADITGSLSVVGPANLAGVTTIDTYTEIKNQHATSIAIGRNNYTGTCIGKQYSVGIGIDAVNTPVGSYHTVVGGDAGRCANGCTTYIGWKAGNQNTGTFNTSIGACSLGAIVSSGQLNTAVGFSSLCNNSTGQHNNALGAYSLRNNSTGNYNTGIGQNSLFNQSSGNYNVALGYNTGLGVSAGSNNLFLGSYAGPSTGTHSNKLYIGFGVGTPLIYGEFDNDLVSISGSLNITGSVSSSTYYGDGSNLTGIQWTGLLNGDASITGSLIISGGVVNFVDTTAISGSIFSGSFVGDGSGLTNIVTDWNGSYTGSASITGSLTVAGTSVIKNAPEASPGVEYIQYSSGSLVGVHNIQAFEIGVSGYTGFKADYTISNSGESQKKVGTLYGGWDQTSAITLNDSYSQIAVGGTSILSTSFSLTNDGSNATLTVDADIGTYDVNMIITAFKKSI